MDESDNAEGPGKGQPFFDRARIAVEAGTYDLAIDLMIEGLNCEPRLVAQHQFLRDIALRRRIAGGMPSDGLFGGKPPMRRETRKALMLNAEWVVTKDPGNISKLLILMRAAVAANYHEVALWFAPIVACANRTSKWPKDEVLTEVITLLEGLYPGDATRQSAIQILCKVLKKPRSDDDARF